MKLDHVVTLGIIGAIGWALFKDHGTPPAGHSQVASSSGGKRLSLAAPSSHEAVDVFADVIDMDEDTVDLE